jgi:hypothetical protein
MSGRAHLWLRLGALALVVGAWLWPRSRPLSAARAEAFVGQRTTVTADAAPRRFFDRAGLRASAAERDVLTGDAFMADAPSAVDEARSATDESHLTN